MAAILTLDVHVWFIILGMLTLEEFCNMMISSKTLRNLVFTHGFKIPQLVDMNFILPDEATSDWNITAARLTTRQRAETFLRTYKMHIQRLRIVYEVPFTIQNLIDVMYESSSLVYLYVHAKDAFHQQVMNLNKLIGFRNLKELRVLHMELSDLHLMPEFCNYYSNRLECCTCHKYLPPQFGIQMFHGIS